MGGRLRWGGRLRCATAQEEQSDSQQQDLPRNSHPDDHNPIFD